MAGKSHDKRVWGPLREIINLSLRSGTLPERLKEALVRPLLKKQGLHPSDYRPVSHLVFLGKVIEWAVVGQLQEFLEETSALDPFQSSFRPGHRVEMALVA